VAAAVAAAVLLIGVVSPAFAIEDLVTDVELWVDEEQGYGLLIVAGTLPEGTEMPAILELPLPQGARVSWVGELALGGELGNDVERSHGVTQGVGGDILQIPLQESLEGQYEAIYIPTEIDGDRRATQLSWIQTSETATLSVAVRMPANIAEVSIEPAPVGPPGVNQFGQTYYVLEPLNPEPGDRLTVNVLYTQQSPLVDLDVRNEGSADYTLLILLVVLVAVGGVLVYVVWSQRRSRDEPAGADEGEPPAIEEPDADEDDQEQVEDDDGPDED
jgi:hypothetical protein